MDRRAALPDEFSAWMTPPDRASFFRRGDPHDPRLGEAVLTDVRGYASSHVVLVGCPQDEGVRRNGGRPGAAAGPDAIRRALFRLTTHGLERLNLFDLGDAIVDGALEQVHDRQRAAVERALRDGKRVISLGGGNDISFPDCAALGVLGSPVTAINVDTHFDVRADQPRNSGTPYRMLIERGHVAPRALFEIGGQPQANSAAYTAWLRDQGAHIFWLSDVRRAGAARLARDVLASVPSPGAVFLGVDLDVVRAAEAPGVSAPNPLGLTGEDVCDLVDAVASDDRTWVVEVAELNPAHDVDGRTARLAALVVWRALAAMSARIR